MDQLNPNSHLLEYLVDIHEGEEKDEIKLRLRIVHSNRTRQILESTVSQQERQHHILANFNFKEYLKMDEKFKPS